MNLADYGGTYILLTVRSGDAQREYTELRQQFEGHAVASGYYSTRPYAFPQYFIWKDDQWKHVGSSQIVSADVRIPNHPNDLSLPIVWKILELGNIVLAHIEITTSDDVRTPYGEHVVRIGSCCHLGTKSIYTCFVLQHNNDEYVWGREVYIHYRQILEKNLTYTDDQLQKIVEANLLL